MDSKYYAQFKKSKISSVGVKRNSFKQKTKHRKRFKARERAVLSDDTGYSHLVDVVSASDSDLMSGQTTRETFERIKLIPNARERSQVLFEWLINPIGIDRFFK